MIPTWQPPASEFLLAQTSEAPADAAPGGAPAQRPTSFFMPEVFGLLLALGVLWFFLLRSQRRERGKHAQMLAALKRNDRVQTIGGIIGTVVEVRDHEVVLKVDESSNVKIRFNRQAVKEVLREPEGEARQK
mgnify:CR=1 FL=1